MDETKSWFYSRSSSLDRNAPSFASPLGPAHQQANSEDFESGTSSPSNSLNLGLSLKGMASAETKRKRFFQRKNTSSAPASSNESIDSSYLNGALAGIGPFGGMGSRAGSQESASGEFVMSKLCINPTMRCFDCLYKMGYCRVLL